MEMVGALVKVSSAFKILSYSDSELIDKRLWQPLINWLFILKCELHFIQMRKLQYGRHGGRSKNSRRHDCSTGIFFHLPVTPYSITTAALKDRESAMRNKRHFVRAPYRTSRRVREKPIPEFVWRWTTKLQTVLSFRNVVQSSGCKLWKYTLYTCSIGAHMGKLLTRSWDPGAIQPLISRQHVRCAGSKLRSLINIF